MTVDMICWYSIRDILNDYILKHSSLTIPRTQEVEFATSERLKDFLETNNIKLYTYDEV